MRTEGVREGVSEGGTEGGREGGTKEGREGGGTAGGREGGKEVGREGERVGVIARELAGGLEGGRQGGDCHTDGDIYMVASDVERERPLGVFDVRGMPYVDFPGEKHGWKSLPKDHFGLGTVSP